MFLPRLDTSDPGNIEALKNDQIWRIIWLVPIIFESVTLMFIPTYYKHLSLKKLIHNERKLELAKSEIQKTYKLSEMKDVESLVLSIKSKSSVIQTGVTLKDALFSKKYRRSSWNAVIFAFFHQYCGHSTVLTLSTQIFMAMQRKG
jgi:hypothetical protein